MSFGKAHAVNVGGTHAFLAGGGVFEAFVYAHKIGFKLHHPRRGEQQSRVLMGHKRAGGNNRQPLGMEKLQKTVSYFCAFHSWSCIWDKDIIKLYQIQTGPALGVWRQNEHSTLYTF